jgi:DNA mismatch repair protein MutS
MEHGDRIVFLHSVKDGPASQSYGLQVAALAGVPQQVISNAKNKLLQLENSAYREQQTHSEINQFDLFTSQECHPAVCLLEELNPDNVTPRQALDLLYRMKKML